MVNHPAVTEKVGSYILNSMEMNRLVERKVVIHVNLLGLNHAFVIAAFLISYNHVVPLTYNQWGSRKLAIGKNHLSRSAIGSSSFPSQIKRKIDLNRLGNDCQAKPETSNDHICDSRIERTRSNRLNCAGVLFNV